MELTATLLALIIVICSLALWSIRRRLTYWQRRGIPHDEPHLLRGNFKGLRSQYHLQDLYRNYYRKYKGTGPFAGFYFFQQPAVFILDLNLAKNILIKDFSSFADRPVYYNEKDDPLSAHLFALDGAKWKALRQKLSPTFSSGKMKFMFPTVVQVGRRFGDMFDQMLGACSTVEVKDLFARFTTDVIGSCAFGIDCNSLSDPNAEFRAMGRLALTKRRHGTLVMGLAQSYPRLCKLLGVGVFHSDVVAFFMRAVRETVEERERKGIKRNDFMNMLIELRKGKAEGMAQLTLEELAAQSFVFFVAGFETSSTTGSFALYELAQHPHMQDRLRQEVNEVLARHNNDFSYECMKEMKYMDQVIAETLRLYTIVPALLRRCSTDYTVPGHLAYVIEKGMHVIIPATAIHRDPELYPEPEQFNPEHFAADRLRARDPITWLPFGDGPRNCIGLRFGKMQTRIGLALLLQRFKFSLDEKTPVPMEYDKAHNLCSSKGGIYLKVERI